MTTRIRPKTHRAFLSSFAAAALAFAAPSQAAPASPDFSREVRPILSRYCFKCHGPDEAARKSELRLDSREGATHPAESGDPAINVKDLPKSELIRRVLSDDKDEMMPPSSAKILITPEQKDILKRWALAGGEYQQHWAFVAPKKSPVPAVPADSKFAGSKNPIDAFVAAKLAEQKLAASPPADPAALARRMYYDLIGLPPTVEELDAFLAEAKAKGLPTAADALADKLLASPQYGERWARKWLDLARYADTNGYEKDRDRSMWPYRDWVINALNADLPFDQFTIAQLAGDLLPNATQDQRIATGFHRNTMLNEEGGIDPLEFRYHAMVDRVATTGTTWLGLTTGCAQCHTHKFDPITHTEYFQLFAFLNNADEPELDLLPPTAAADQATRAKKLAEQLTALPDQWPVADADAKAGKKPRDLAEAKFTEWLTKERARAIAWTPLRPATAKSNLPLLTIQPDASVWASGDFTKSDTYDLHFTGLPRGVTALRLEALPDDRLPAHGPGMTYYEGPKGDFFLGEFQLTAQGQPVKIAKGTESFAKNNFSNGASAQLAIDGDPQTGWTCAGQVGVANEAVFVLAAPLAGTEVDLKMLFGRHFASSLGRFRVSFTTQAGAEARKITDEIQRLLVPRPTPLNTTELATLREHFLLTASELDKPAKAIRALRKPPTYTTSLVLRERPPENPRITYRQHRGEFLQPKERVEPGVPAFLPPLPKGAPLNRLTFARWLVSRDHPLTARVTVNRAWASFFGRGLVKTLDDFGYQGETPSHPELLDWLAVDFIDQGWSLKKLHRLIVTSATYRQSARSTPELIAQDPENRYLAHFPRVRLEAELVRDGALRATGLLTTKVGGPSVRPPQPEGVTEVAYGGAGWTADQGPARYRRSLYTFAKRTAPFALYNTFDAPTGEACVARRDVSNTPLQALSLLNDPVILEAAQALAAQLATRPGPFEPRLQEAARRLLARPLDPTELARLAKFYDTQKARFESKELDPQKATAAKSPQEATPEKAAWLTVLRAMMNLDEAVTKG
jgi:hypothetical protein